MAEDQKRFITSFDFSDITAALTRDFTGRAWLFDEIDGWLAEEKGSRTLILTGEPGIGKSAVAAKVTEMRPVAARHFCIARRADTLDPYLFARSLSAQLTELEGFSEAVLREADARVEVRQKVERNMGQVIGAIVNAPSAAAAFNRAVAAPLRAVAGRDGDGPLVIVVDGLDEAVQFPGRENIVRLLAGVALPQGVRLLLTTRPESGVLDHFERANAPVRLIDAGKEENMADARRYVRERVQASEMLQARLAEAEVTAGDFAARAAEAGKGNFLYLSWLLPAVERGEQSPGAEAEFPPGLDGVYREFLLRRDLRQDRREWRSLYRPLLGALAAAEEPLTAEQAAGFSGLTAQETADGLLDAGQFLEPVGRSEGRYQLYHQSLVDFLGSRERAGGFWIDLGAVHGQIADVYLEEAAPDWSRADGYGLRHLPRHLQAAGRVEALQELLLYYRWLQAKVAAVGVTSLLADFELLEAREGPLQAQQLLYEALRLSAHVLARDPGQLASQLWGRLGERPEEALSALLAQAVEGEEGVWLRPVRPTLDLPGGPLLRTLAGHGDWVNAVAVTPDGGRVVSASGDGTLKVWELESGRELRTLTGHRDLVRDVAVTPDGGRAVSGSEDGTVKVWDLASGRELRTLAGHGDWVKAVAVTPDGRRAVSGSEDRMLKVWDLASGRELRTLAGHGGPVLAVAVTPDGGRAVSGSEDGTLKVWELASGRELRRLAEHGDWVSAVAVTPDGRWAVSASNDRTLKVWELASGRELRTLAGHGGGVQAVAVTPDGERAVSGSVDRKVKVWELASGRELRTLAGHGGPVDTVAVTPDGGRAVSGSYDRTLKVWELASGRELRTLEGHGSWVSAVAVTPDGGRAVSGSGDGTVKVWELASGRELRTLEGHGSAVNAVAVTPDGGRAVSGWRDGAVKVWDLESGDGLRTLAEHGSVVNAVAVTPDGGRAVSGSYDRTLKVWELTSGAQAATFTGESGMLSCAVAPDGRTIVAGERLGRVHFLRLEGVEAGRG